MTIPIIKGDDINMNVTQETVEIPVAQFEYACIEIVTDAAFSTWVGEVMYKVHPACGWRSFSTPVTLTAAAPNSNLIGTTGIMFLGVRTTTKQGGAAYGTIYACGDNTQIPAARIG